MRAFILLLLVASSAAAQESISLLNTMPEPIRVWIDYRDKTRAGPFFMVRNDVQRIDLEKPGKYYLTIQDTHRRNLIVGWVDLHDLARESDEIALLALYQARGHRLPGAYDGLISWRPIGSPYAWRVRIVPFTGEPVPVHKEIIFVNDPSTTVERSYECAEYFE
jgi:hypothetical protein